MKKKKRYGEISNIMYASISFGTNSIWFNFYKLIDHIFDKIAIVFFRSLRYF